MSNLFTLTIPDNPTTLLGTYGAGALIRVQGASTQTGSFSAVATTPIVSGVTTYPFLDSAGSPGYWYKYRYEAAAGAPASAYSAASQPNTGRGIYATVDELEDFLGITMTATQRTQGSIAITAASWAIRSTCGRDFAAPTGASESRYFALDSYLPPTIEIDDLSEGTGLTIAFDDGTGTYPTTVTTGYDLLPLNASTRSFPYTRISFRTYTVVPAWRLSGPLVKVTSSYWGWSTTPDVVKQACLIQASRLFKRKDSPFGIAGSPAEGNVLRLLAKLDPDVQLLLGGDLLRYPGFVG